MSNGSKIASESHTPLSLSLIITEVERMMLVKVAMSSGVFNMLLKYNVPNVCRLVGISMR